MGQCCSNFCKEFKEFILRGNVLDLAIGIIIGTAFSNVVQSFVDDIFTPPLGLILGGTDFVNLTIKMKNFVYKNEPPVIIRYGKFIQAIITLLIVALALFFIIKAVSHLHKITARNKERTDSMLEHEASEEVKVLREIRDVLTRQSHLDSSSHKL